MFAAIAAKCVEVDGFNTLRREVMACVSDEMLFETSEKELAVLCILIPVTVQSPHALFRCLTAMRKHPMAIKNMTKNSCRYPKHEWAPRSQW